MDFNRIFPFYYEEMATIVLGIGIGLLIIAIIVVIVFLCRRPDPDKFKTKVRIREGDKFSSAFQDSFAGYPLVRNESHI